MVSDGTPFLCVLPWNHLFIGNDGKPYTCCVSQTKSITPSQRDGIKKTMLAGNVPEACTYCHQIETSEKSSYRQHVNRLFNETYLKIQSGIDTISNEYLDLRLGNLCNKKCRMCSPKSSRLLNDEFGAYYKNEYHLIYQASDENLEIIESTFETVKRINFAGGEPFLMESVFNLLNELKTRNRAQFIDLTLNTNLSTLPERFMNCLSNFKSVKLTVSIDGYDELNDYIRYPTNWHSLLKNIEIVQNRQFEIAINCTVQIYNIFHLEKFINFFSIEKSFPIYFNLLSQPDFLNVQALPLELKLQALNLLQNLQQKYPSESQIEGIINYMQLQDKSALFGEFINWTNYLDNSRAQSFGEFNPLISDYVGRTSFFEKGGAFNGKANF